MRRIRRRSLFGLFIAGLLLVVFLIFYTRKEEVWGTASRGENFGFQADLKVAPLPSLPPQNPAPTPQALATAAATTAEAQVVRQPTIAQPRASVGPNLLSLKKLFPATSLPEPIGVIDTDRLLLVYPPGSDSAEARAKAISDIERATAICAAAHDCAVVLDISGKSRSGVPVVISAVETFDLTEEVTQQLGR